MKRIAIMTVCVLTALGAAAQSHSFRDTSYVRYEQFDFDAYLLADSNGSRGKVYNNKPIFPGNGFGDVLQYNYTDNPAGMKVVGLSAVIDLSGDYLGCGLDGNVPAEYLLLYEADADTFQELARVRWYETDTAGRPYFHFIYRGIACDSIGYWGIFTMDNDNACLRIFDYYFDKPITVYDSFYVGGTDHTHALDPQLGNHESYAGYWTFWTILYTYSPSDTECLCPSLWKYCDYRVAPYQWHWMRTAQFMMVLPIIEVVDTSFANAPECPRASGVFVRGSYTDTVTMQWDYDSLHTEFEVSYGREGTPPDAGTIVTVYDNRWQFTDTAYSDTPMVSYVRTVCREYDTLRWSGWSGSVRWRLHHDADTNHTDIDVPEDQGDLSRHVRLMPNPAGGNVLVMSSYGMERVEVYDARGGKVYGQAASGTTAGFDVSKWPKGAYVVLVRTAAGTAAKRLVVQ